MNEGTFTVRTASELDFQEIAELFSHHDFGPKRLEWMRWKYLDNPDGEPLIYVVVDSGGSIVAVSARLPRRFVGANGVEFTARQNVDILVADDLRQKGIYALIRERSQAERDFMLIGFPNKLSRPMVKQDKTELTPIVNWAFPVSAGKLVASKPYGFVAPLVNVLCRVYAFLRLGGKPANIHMKPLERFVNDYKVTTTLIHGIRSAAYLNWRFVDNPMQKFRAYEFCEGSEGIGYCAFRVIESEAELYDFVASRHEKSCLRLLVEHCRNEGFTHLSFPGVGLRMDRLGFFDRGSESDFTAFRPQRGPKVPEGDWMLTFCDRDV